MWRLILVGIAVIAVVIFGFSLMDVASGDDITASTLIQVDSENIEGFARAVEPYDWQFPQDYGAHERFQTEWWYYTGNLATDDGRRFGYQFTIFRRAITPQASESESDWRTNQMYMAHFTVSDIAAGEFHHEQRFSRGSAGLAGATVQPRYRVWLEDWEVLATDSDAQHTRIQAAMDGVQLDVSLEQVKPLALQGDDGLSPKSGETGNASYYYSLSRLLTDGTITVDGEEFSVSGVTWMDHEFSTSALGDNAQGWDWFGLIFDDNTELMIGHIRLIDGGFEPAFGGLYIREDGSTQYLPADSFTITPTDTWTSPHSGAEYPSGWVIEIAHADVSFTLDVQPLMDDQELHGSGFDYWEGAVRITGDKSGYGYAELTGYAGTMQGRF